MNNPSIESLKKQMATVIQLNREAAKKRESKEALLRQWAQN